MHDLKSNFVKTQRCAQKNLAAVKFTVVLKNVPFCFNFYVVGFVFFFNSFHCTGVIGYNAGIIQLQYGVESPDSVRSILTGHFSHDQFRTALNQIIQSLSYLGR